MELKRVHIVGVGGTLMGAFASYLKRRGVRVSGSDQAIYPPMSDVLKDAGVEIFTGYRAENLPKDADLIVIGNVIRKDNPEARAAIDGGLPYSSLPEAMERFFLPQTRNLVVAGTHGKTTTSSMLAHVLVQLRKEPSYFIGGVSQDLPHSFQVSSLESGKYFVLEGDEYDTAFWDKVPKFNHYLPNDVMLTSVEYDHADIYPDFAAVVRAFEGLMDRIRPGGRLIACADYEAVRKLTERAKVPVIFYGSQGALGAKYTVGKITTEAGLTKFEVCESGKVLDVLSLQVPGNHNCLNALAVWIETKELGLDLSKVKAALASFKGVKRRQEVRGEVQGVLVIDDFAHHPTAVRETLKALRAKYSGRRLISVFEPRSATSRRKVFQKDYAEAFGEADLSFIAIPFDQSGISEGDRFSSDDLLDDLKRLGKRAELMASVEEGVGQVARASQKGDVIAVLSNGGFGGFISKLLEALRSR